MSHQDQPLLIIFLFSSIYSEMRNRETETEKRCILYLICNKKPECVTRRMWSEKHYIWRLSKIEKHKPEMIKMKKDKTILELEQ